MFRGQRLALFSAASVFRLPNHHSPSSPSLSPINLAPIFVPNFFPTINPSPLTALIFHYTLINFFNPSFFKKEILPHLVRSGDDTTRLPFTFSSSSPSPSLSLSEKISRIKVKQCQASKLTAVSRSRGRGKKERKRGESAIVPNSPLIHIVHRMILSGEIG